MRKRGLYLPSNGADNELARRIYELSRMDEPPEWPERAIRGHASAMPGTRVYELRQELHANIPAATVTADRRVTRSQTEPARATRFETPPEMQDGHDDQENPLQEAVRQSNDIAHDSPSQHDPPPPIVEDR